jgi:hypothetical protein
VHDSTLERRKFLENNISDNFIEEKLIVAIRASSEICPQSAEKLSNGSDRHTGNSERSAKDFFLPFEMTLRFFFAPLRLSGRHSEDLA